MFNEFAWIPTCRMSRTVLMAYIPCPVLRLCTRKTVGSDPSQTRAVVSGNSNRQMIRKIDTKILR